MILFWLLNIGLWASFAAYNYAFLRGKWDFRRWRAVVSIFIAFIFGLIPLLNLTPGFWPLVKLFIISLSIRWNVFDAVLNYLCGKNYFYTGNVNRDSDVKKVVLKNGQMDIFFGKWQFPLKWALLLISIILSV